MKIAAVIANDGDTVMPLVQGDRIRIMDTKSRVEVEIDNPALLATSARRIAALKGILEQGVDAVIAPPETFCSHSYEVAKIKGLLFWKVSEGSSWSGLFEGVDEPGNELLQKELSTDELAVHGHQNKHR